MKMQLFNDHEIGDNDRNTAIHSGVAMHKNAPVLGGNALGNVLDAARDDIGQLKSSTLLPAEWKAFSGILGHYHVQSNKVDPGPAFDWERVIQGVRASL